jgi:gentisate 1,2-dioxygenase
VALAEKRTSDFYRHVAEIQCAPLWTMRDVLSSEPYTRMLPHLWEWRLVHDVLLRAAEVVSVEEAERRAIAFRNPGAPSTEIARTSDTLWAGVQLLLPGERARAHRHSAAALRFVIAGEGAATVVDGEAYEMERGDLILTPSWSWHEHVHRGRGPVMWVDGLDLPLVYTIPSMFLEERVTQYKRSTPGEVSARGEGPQFLFPAKSKHGITRHLKYSLPEARERLAELRHQRDGQVADVVLLEYGNPLTGGHALPTISAYIQLLAPGARTAALQDTASYIFHVVEGRGYSVIADQRIDWTEGDTFVAPAWTCREHVNPTGGDALLFVFSDRPVVEALGLLQSAGERR